jgi:hypothetical protein
MMIRSQGRAASGADFTHLLREIATGLPVVHRKRRPILSAESMARRKPATLSIVRNVHRAGACQQQFHEELKPGIWWR